MKPIHPTSSPRGPQPQWLVDAIERMDMLRRQGRHAQALEICLQITQAYPELASAWSDAATGCIHLGRWQEAIGHAQTALACGAEHFVMHDALAHAHGQLGQWREARRHGLQALDMRARQFDGAPIIPWQPLPLPPLPCAQTRERNIIAFSLFGRDSKYCETAILNAQAQPDIYPHWVCRFYIDASVPHAVVRRLRASGGQIVTVRGPEARWPGPMWRFLALDDAQAHRVLLRDADSLISRREARAVGQWLASGKRFHMMRDDASHTELMHAGLWGAVNGSLPPLDELMLRFMSAPLQSEHFADQHFLRQYVWPYARASLMQHDSVFGFLNAAPFPDEKVPGESPVGNCEGWPIFTAKSPLPDGTPVTWELHKIETPHDGAPARAHVICAYAGTVRNGAVVAHVPVRYAQWLHQRTARIRIVGDNAAAQTPSAHTADPAHRVVAS